MTDSLTLPAVAKVNLYLHVTGKRDDGYHLLDSLVAFPPAIADELNVNLAHGFSLTLTGPNVSNLTAGDDNIATRAAKITARLLGRPQNVAIYLRKNIPIGAGLGGGSSDAATTVKALQQLWGKQLNAEDREELLLFLGADVPVCYAAHACRFKGIGEVVGPKLTLPPLHILLVWPGHATLTKDIFARLPAAYSPPLPAQLPPLDTKDSLIAFLKTTRNDLQDIAEDLYPNIKKARLVLENNPDCLLARMSGSGSSVFGLFDTQEACTAAAQKIQQSHTSWWTAHSPLA
jgi:4-diphosphocytidyl-2-C-methyl-D-erythritol kinase